MKYFKRYFRKSKALEHLPQFQYENELDNVNNFQNVVRLKDPKSLKDL